MITTTHKMREMINSWPIEEVESSSEMVVDEISSSSVVGDGVEKTVGWGKVGR